jgi:hypothetical protein
VFADFDVIVTDSGFGDSVTTQGTTEKAITSA